MSSGQQLGVKQSSHHKYTDTNILLKVIWHFEWLLKSLHRSRQSLIMPLINDGFWSENIFSEIFIWLYGVQIDQLINKDGLNHFIGVMVRKKYWDAWCMIRKWKQMFNVQCPMRGLGPSDWENLCFILWHNHITWHITCIKSETDRRTIVLCVS